MAYDVYENIGTFGFTGDAFDDISILEIAGISQAMCERIYCLNGGRLEPVLEHLHYVCFFSNAIYMALQGRALFFDDFYLGKDGKVYSPVIRHGWGENEHQKLRKLYHRSGISIKGTPDEFQTGVARVTCKHIYKQEICAVRATIENSRPYLKAKAKAEDPLYKKDEEERVYGIRISRRDMKKWMNEIRKKCGAMEKMGSEELCLAFREANENNTGFIGGDVPAGLNTVAKDQSIDMESDMTDEELKAELETLKKPIDSGFDLNAYVAR